MRFVLLLKNSGHDESNWSFRALSWVAITISKTVLLNLLFVHANATVAWLSKVARSSEKWAYYRNYVVCLVCTQPVCICISHMQLHDDDAMQE
ncbi:hypothetical protein Prudu_021714 [Prunus dulcis]|uniref:Uncharacterized protein n=1 Tax=Prunus dulcis TaxID=3755 RepID=A0A4Y1RZU1_PRUDU|nr:hypothetical protein Prudu_021714 [Prunus dulcis]